MAGRLTVDASSKLDPVSITVFVHPHLASIRAGIVIAARSNGYDVPSSRHAYTTSKLIPGVEAREWRSQRLQSRSRDEESNPHCARVVVLVYHSRAGEAGPGARITASKGCFGYFETRVSDVKL